MTLADRVQRNDTAASFFSLNWLEPQESGEDVSALLAHYRTPDGILDFTHDILHVTPAPYQAHIMRTFVDKRRVAVRGAHGMGKTSLASWIVLWSIATAPADVKVVMTASAWRQLTFYLAPEVKKWARHGDWARIGLQMREGKELLEQQIKMNDREAFPVASDNPMLIEGAHASRLVYVFDEAKAIPNDTWDAAEGAFSTGEAFALAISTPGEPSGRFYDIHARKPGYEDWTAIHVTLEEAIAAGRISQEWVAARKKQWGEASAVYQNRVLGNFDTSGEDNVVPLAWVEQSNARWLAVNGKGEGNTAYGVDPAWKGEDKSAIARKVGVVIERVESHAKEDTMQTAGRVAAAVNKRTPVAIDTIGVGAGVYDRLKELAYSVRSVNVSKPALNPHSKKPLTDESGTVTFVNLRSALWWMLREAIDPSNPDAIALPPDDQLTGDLTAPKWWYNSKGQIVVESKDDIRERIGRSPDKADAVALALYAERFGRYIPVVFA